MYASDYGIWQKLNSVSDEKIQECIVHAEYYVRKRHPHAVLMFTTNRKGIVTHVGIYESRLLLNERHNWHANKQYAPQLLEQRYPFSDEWNAKYKVRYLQMVWESLAFAILGDEISKRA